MSTFETETARARTRFLAFDEPVELESGLSLPQVTVAYRT